VVYDAGGSRIADFGGTGSKLGKLNAPAQITLDGAGNLWVAERGNNRVQQFGPNGERLMAFGARGVGPGEFIHPTGISVDCNNVVTVADSDNNRVQTFALAAPLPGPSCVPLATPAPPPPLKFPTLPAPLGPQLTVRVLRTSGLLTARNLPVRVGCDTTCTLSASVVITPRARPAKGKKPVSITTSAPTQTIAAGASKMVRFTLKVADANRLRKVLGRHRGLDVSLQLQATAAAGQPTSQSTRLKATA
jgi:hypothetical protein